MTNKKVAIIGGKGFIGKFIAESFDKEKISYTIFDKVKNENTKFLDITDKTSFSGIDGHDVIINLAAEHRDDVKPISQYDLVNVQGAKNICEYASYQNIKEIIFTSSVAVYGFAKRNTDEQGEINYFNDYGRTKFLAEKVYKDWYEKDPKNRKLVIVRPTVVFGEGNRGNVYNLIQQIKNNRFVMIGSGENIKSMAYVRNVAEFIKFSLDLDKNYHLYNYVDKPDLSMNSLIKLLKKLINGQESIGFRLPSAIGIFVGYLADFIAIILHRKFSISSIRIKKFIKTTQFSSSNLEIVFKAPFSIEEGIKKTIEYENKK